MPPLEKTAEIVTPNPDPTGLDFLSGTETELRGEEVVDFLSDTLDLDRSRHVEAAIATDPDLREKLVSLQSTWDYLSLLPALTLSRQPQQQAIDIVEQELRRLRRLELAKSGLAMAVSTLLVIAAWLAGNNLGRSNQAAMDRFGRRLPIIQLLSNIKDVEQFNHLVSDDRSALFERVNHSDAQDLAFQIRQFASRPLDVIEPKTLENEFREYLALPADRRKMLESMADQLDSMPEDLKNQATSRLYGYSIWLDSLNANEKTVMENAAAPKIRWNRTINNAQQFLRQTELTKKQSFSIPELNTPDDVLDLATVTAAWLKMSPQERLTAERKFRNQPKGSGKKNDRIRQLMLLIEKSPPGTFPVLELMKNNAPAKIAAKANPRRQATSAARQTYQDAVRTASANQPTGPELLSFLQTLPPWVVEMIEPLPPDEAQRFLAILKILIEKNNVASP